MATGGAVVCTDAHGNRDFCSDGDNCLMPEANAQPVAAAVTRLLADPALRCGSGRPGWPPRPATAGRPGSTALEQFMFEIARPRKIEPSTDAVPGPRRR